MRVKMLRCDSYAFGTIPASEQPSHPKGQKREWFIAKFILDADPVTRAVFHTLVSLIHRAGKVEFN